MNNSGFIAGNITASVIASFTSLSPFRSLNVILQVPQGMMLSCILSRTSLLTLDGTGWAGGQANGQPERGRYCGCLGLPTCFVYGLS